MISEIEYTNEELNRLEIISDDLIIELFETKDKRYVIKKALKKAFKIGREKMREKKLHTLAP